MAIALECINIIVPKAVIESHFPGGLVAYRLAIPNQTYREDAFLTCVGFMSTRDAYSYIDRLVEQGLHFAPDTQHGDIAQVTRDSEHAPDWLVLGDHLGRRVSWLHGEPPGEIVSIPPQMLSVCTPSLLQQLPSIFNQIGIGWEYQSMSVEHTSTTYRCFRGDAQIKFDALDRADPSADIVLISTIDSVSYENRAEVAALFDDIMLTLAKYGSRVETG